MSIQRSLARGGLTHLHPLWSPCSQDIDRVQAAMMPSSERKLLQGASSLRASQPHCIVSRTPGSIAAAAVNLVDISPEKIQAVETLMTRAREADRAGDQSACEQALAEVQRVFFQ